MAIFPQNFQFSILQFSIKKGCNEKFDLEFIKWLLIDGRTKRRREKFAKICKEYGEKVVVLKNRAEVLEYLKTLKGKK